LYLKENAMKVMVAEEMGMCFGVRDALAALDAIAEPGAVTIHGQLVHNEVVLHQLGARGFRMSRESDRERLPETEMVLITAHGISQRERTRLESAGKKLVDTTCPLVRRVHDTATRLQREGYHIVLIGRPGHVEVRGIVEDLQAYDVVERTTDVRQLMSDRLAIVCQTTIAPRTVAEVHAALVAANPQAEIRFVDTTCQPTRLRQHSVEKLIPLVQAMVVVGGSNSNNTRELVELCRRNGRKTWQVRDASELQSDWFRDIDCVGLTAGTSTLDETIREVRDWLYHHQPTRLPRVQSSAEWVRYFKQNAVNLRPIPWEQGACITPDELSAIASSLRGWQLGETSDGRQLRAVARRYADTMGDPEFNEAIDLFIKEEQRHGETLGLFLDLAGVERARSDWGDNIFRVFRHALPRIEIWATIVIVVEVHALIYYNALRRATGSPVLRRSCEQILADEVPHIRFQCERLAILHRNRSRPLLAFTMLIHRFLFTGITLAIWLGHRRALRAGGYTFNRFWQAAWNKMNAAWRRMSPGRYRWIQPADTTSEFCQIASRSKFPLSSQPLRI